MKYCFLAPLLILSTLACKAQPIRATNKIYWDALHEYTLAIDTMYDKYSDLFKDKRIYLQKPGSVDSIPPVVDGYDIVLITPANQRKLYKDHGNKLIHTLMSNVMVEDTLLHITFTPYRGELRKHNHYNLGVSDGTTVYFKYDCATGKFVVYKLKNWGI